ncbi:MAG: hypothetical protein WCE44_00020 [Candidatus Velthaea sp.]|jgi:hypothetical protein
MNATRIRTLAAACAFAAAAFIPNVASAASTFYGIVTHVAVNSIKVEDPRTKQTLGFEILPKFDQVFSGDGKTTYQMKDVRPGRYVGIVYDQKFLGVRHADKVYILNNRNQRLSSQ